MFNVYVNGMKVAGADNLGAALHYAHQYREEGEVTVKQGKKVVCVMSAAGGGDFFMKGSNYE